MDKKEKYEEVCGGVVAETLEEAEKSLREKSETE